MSTVSFESLLQTRMGSALSRIPSNHIQRTTNWRLTPFKVYGKQVKEIELRD